MQNEKICMASAWLRANSLQFGESSALLLSERRQTEQRDGYAESDRTGIELTLGEYIFVAFRQHEYRASARFVRKLPTSSSRPRK